MNLDALMSPYVESARHRAEEPRHRADVLPAEGEVPSAHEFSPRHRADQYAA